MGKDILIISENWGYLDREKEVLETRNPNDFISLKKVTEVRDGDRFESYWGNFDEVYVIYEHSVGDYNVARVK